MTIATSGNITYANLYNQSYANIYNLINTRANVPLPAGLPSDHKFVCQRIPKTLSREFHGFPFIVIPNLDLTQSSGSLSGTRDFVTYDIDIQIYFQDKSSDSLGDPSGAESVNLISDNVLKTLNANRATLRSYGLFNFQVTATTSDYDEIDGKSVFMRELSITFMQRQAVTA